MERVSGGVMPAAAPAIMRLSLSINANRRTPIVLVRVVCRVIGASVFVFEYFPFGGRASSRRLLDLAGLWRAPAIRTLYTEPANFHPFTLRLVGLVRMNRDAFGIRLEAINEGEIRLAQNGPSSFSCPSARQSRYEDGTEPRRTFLPLAGRLVSH